MLLQHTGGRDHVYVGDDGLGHILPVCELLVFELAWLWHPISITSNQVLIVPHRARRKTARDHFVTIWGTTKQKGAPRISRAPHRHAVGTGRSGRARTRDLRFWRPLLYQLSYAPRLPSPRILMPGLTLVNFQLDLLVGSYLPAKMTATSTGVRGRLVQGGL